jgi:hypothetical protein
MADAKELETSQNASSGGKVFARFAHALTRTVIAAAVISAALH